MSLRMPFALRAWQRIDVFILMSEIDWSLCAAHQQGQGINHTRRQPSVAERLLMIG